MKRVMTMKRVWMVATISLCLLALSGVFMVWGKAHVPLDHVQVCYQNSARNIPASSLNIFLELGACRLPACDSDQVFSPDPAEPSNDCTAVNMDADGDGFCDGTVPRLNPADGQTARCSNPH